MGFKLDVETDEFEGITITQSSKKGDTFVKNYKCFGWYLYAKRERPVFDDEGRRYQDADLYDYVLYRDKNHPNIDQLRALENKFQSKIQEINVREEALVGVGEKLNPDYFDFRGDKPVIEVYKLTKGTIILNTALCMIMIGFLMWADSLLKLAKNGKAKKYIEIQKECVEILNEAESLL